MGFALLLLEGFGSTLSEIVEVDEADGMGLQEIFSGCCLGGEPSVTG